MAGSRPRKPSAPKAPGAHEFMVLVEDMRSQFKVFGEGLHGLRENMERRFDEVDKRFEAVDKRFDAVDRRFERLEGEVSLVKTAVLETSADVRRLDERLGRVEQKLDKKVDRDEVAGIVEKMVARAGP